MVLSLLNFTWILIIFTSAFIRAQCEAEIKGFPQAKYRKFPTLEEAENFVKLIDDRHSKVSIQSNNVSVQSQSGSKSKSLATAYYAVAKGKKIGIYPTW